MRRLLLALLTVAVVPAFFMRSAKPVAGADRTVWRVDLMPRLHGATHLPGAGGLDVVGAWQLRGNHLDFGNFSALAPFRGDSLVSMSDRGAMLVLTRPDRPGPWVTRLGLPSLGKGLTAVSYTDAEAMMIDPATHDVVIAYEGVTALVRRKADFTQPRKIPMPALGDWPRNKGPEAMARLADGRTVIIGELYAHTFDRRLHPALVFPGLPRPYEAPGRFMVAMPEGYRPTELTQLPDGRLLVLGRKLTLAGFRSVLALADPAAVRPGAVVQTHEIARIDDPRICENYEGMTVTRESDGSIAIWLISDSNAMVALQRTLLLKLRLRP